MRPATCARWVSTALLALLSCGQPPTSPVDRAAPTPTTANHEASLPLAIPCAFSSGVVTVVLSAAEHATVSVNGGNQLLVNGVVCSTATTTNTTRISISSQDLAAATDETVTIDASGGFYSLGTASAAGITVALGNGAGDVFELLGSTADDVIVVGHATNGDEWLTLNHDTYRDVTVTGAEGITIKGQGGNDVVSGSGLYAGWVRSSYYSTGVASAVPLTLLGQAGNDQLNGGAAADSVLGGDDNDTLEGSASDDTENGEAGDDTLNQGAALNGADTLIGGSGTDTVSYGSRTSSVLVTVGSSANDGETGEIDDVRSDVEVVAGGTADDALTCPAVTGCTLSGGGGNDVLTGRGGADTLNGDLGDDLLVPGTGDDVLTGGAGTDTVSYSGVAQSVTVALGTPGTPSTGNGSSGENDSLDTIENIVGGNAGDALTGNALDNRLTGGPGDDVLNGGGGDDVFDEGSTANGADTLNGGGGEDRVDYSGRASALTVTLDGVANDGSANEHDNVGTDVENLTGGAGDDSITGNGLDNKLDGLGGNDTLTGLGGADELTGGNGTNTLAGGDGDDTLDESIGSGSCDCGNGFDIAICPTSSVSCEVR